MTPTGTDRGTIEPPSGHGVGFLLLWFVVPLAFVLIVEKLGIAQWLSAVVERIVFLLPF